MKLIKGKKKGEITQMDDKKGLKEIKKWEFLNQSNLITF
jgi:hypothetical protein